MMRDSLAVTDNQVDNHKLPSPLPSLLSRSLHEIANKNDLFPATQTWALRGWYPHNLKIVTRNTFVATQQQQ